MFNKVYAMKFRFPIFVTAMFLFFAMVSCSRPKKQLAHFQRPLKNHWLVFRSDSVSGQQVSLPGYHPRQSYSAEVPSTLMHVLVQNGVYRNAFQDMNLKKIPTDQFRHPWWYRTTFHLSSVPQTLLLRFNGINYKADVWLNGKKIADHSNLKNPFRQFIFRITKEVKKGENVLAVKVYPPQDGDFTIGFVDWNPAPPDHNMGLFRGVSLEACHEVGISQPYIVSSLSQNFHQATLTASVRVTNYTSVEQFGKVFVKIEDKTISKPVTLLPYETKKIVLGATQFPELVIDHPRLWWPYTLGTPHLYHAVFSFHNAGTVTDSKTITFGIRKISSFFTRKGFRGFMINGRKILIRGGGWVDHLFLDDTPKSNLNQLLYVKNMGLNTIRLEGFWGNSSNLYSTADSLGIMIMVGWSCEWEWENLVKKKCDPKYGGILTPSEIALMSDAWKDQIVWLRNHPPVFAWLGGSDKMPKSALEKRYLNILKNYDSTRVYLPSAKEWTSTVGPSAVKMRGPYAYVPPVYWFQDTLYGGAYGFNTETGPGAQIPPLQSIENMLSPQNRWPIDSVWNFHCGRHAFSRLDRYTTALEKRYGKPLSLADFVKKAQVLNYELMRPMFEAFSAYRYKSTGVIQWMLNSSWPEMYWQLYDYYLNPNGAYYGAQKASQPYHAIYDYAHRAIYVVNDKLDNKKGCFLKIRVYNDRSQLKFEKKISLDLPADSSRKVFTLPDRNWETPVYFLDLRLSTSSGKVIDNNFYWLSTQKDILNYKASNWYETPTVQYADYTALNTIPKVKPEAEVVKQTVGKNYTVFTVKLKNKSRYIAFFEHADIVDQNNGKTILPVLWSDNDVSLLPGETRILTAKIDNRYLKNKTPRLTVKGYNE